MTQFDSTQAAQIEQKIANAVERPRMGRVVKVSQHITDEDESNFELDIRMLDSIDTQLRSVPWQSQHADEIKVPKVGDKVIVETRGQSTETPIARNHVHTSGDRPPKGTAGVWRKKIESGDSPAGTGDLYVEADTQYDQDPSRPSFEPETASVERSYIRLAKKQHDLDITSRKENDLPMSIEIVDANDESNITVKLNYKDGFQTAATWGMQFDAKTGEFKLVDSSGYGIESDGDGNFTWHYETIDHSQGTTMSI